MDMARTWRRRELLRAMGGAERDEGRNKKVASPSGGAQIAMRRSGVLITSALAFVYISPQNRVPLRGQADMRRRTLLYPPRTIGYEHGGF
jgi:hypothetical protein